MAIDVVVLGRREVTAEGLVAVLRRQPDVVVAGAADTVEAAVALAAPGQLDVVVADLSPQDADVDRLVEGLQALPVVPAVVLFPGGHGMHVPPGRPVLAVVHAEEPASRLVSAVRRAAVGMPTWPEPPAAVGEDLRRFAELTDREWEVLAALAEGHGPAAIAERLVLSIHTARNHLRAIMAKLGTSTQVETHALVLRLQVMGDLDVLRQGAGLRLPGGGR